MLTYSDASKLLGNRAAKKIGHATSLEWGLRYHADPVTGERTPSDDPNITGVSIDVVYHETPVVTIHPDDSYTLRTGGWYSATTKRRIEEFAPVTIHGSTNRGGCLTRFPMEGPTDCAKPGGPWFLGDVEFEDGMVVDSAGRPLDYINPEV